MAFLVTLGSLLRAVPTRKIRFLARFTFRSCTLREPYVYFFFFLQSTAQLIAHHCKQQDGQIALEDFTTPLQVLLKKQKPQVFRNLLEKGAGEYLEARDKDGNHALHVACALDQHESVALLLKKGADVKAKNERGFTVSAGCCVHSFARVCVCVWCVCVACAFVSCLIIHIGSMWF